jgi:uncharacterized protein (TIGR02145 family)
MKILRFTSFVILPFFLFILSGCEKKTNTDVDATTTGTVTDVDGNVYGTVKIGSQWWMTENLKVTSFNDGSKIRAILSTEKDSIWAKLDSAAFCKTDGRYGLLYNWFVVNDKKLIAPKGWHIPTDDDWKKLEVEIGMAASEADKTGWRGVDQAENLVIKSSEGWSDPVHFGKNGSGFTALPGGCRVFNGSYNVSSNTAFWWTSSEKNDQVYYRYIDSKMKTIFRHYTYKQYGFSIRCVKD